MQDELSWLLAGRRGHFRMESGYHSEWWFDLDRLFRSEADALRPFVTELGRRLGQHRPDAICGPMTGGAKLARSMATELGVEYFFAERREHPEREGLFPVDYVLPVDQQAAAKGKTFAIVDDAISAGSAVRGTHATLLAAGARPVALGALFVFGDAGARFAADRGLALERISQLPFELWTQQDCPLCRSGIACENISDAV